MANETILGDEKLRFLSLVEIRRRSTVTNLFLKQARQGMTNPSAVVEGVLNDLRDKIDSPWSSVESRQRDGLTLEIVTGNTQAALGFAAWAVAYAAMSEPELQEHKRRNHEQHVQEWLSGQPATAAQISYLRNLGHRGEVGSKLDASRLIDSFKGGSGL